MSNVAPSFPTRATTTNPAHTTTTRGVFFCIPACILDLEHEPYNLLPYPIDFDQCGPDRDSAYQRLVLLIRDQYCRLTTLPLAQLFPRRASNNIPVAHAASSKQDDGSEDDDGYDDIEDAVVLTEAPWMNEDAMQALYTLTRKSTSLTPSTKQDFVHVLSQTVEAMCDMVIQAAEPLSSSFREAWTFHLYMLYMTQVLLEADIKAQIMTTTATVSTNSNGKDAATAAMEERLLRMRRTATAAMLEAARTMAHQPQNSNSSQRAIMTVTDDEAVIMLPCQIALTLLPLCTGVTARKQACGDVALHILSCTLDGAAVTGGRCDSSILSTLSAALMDLLHAHEHMASLVAELCREQNRLAVELLRQVAHLDSSASSNHHAGATAAAAAASSTGLKYIAALLPGLAETQPRVVLQQLPTLLHYLQADNYAWRNAMVQAMAQILLVLDHDHRDDYFDQARGNPTNQQQPPGSVTSANDESSPIFVSESTDGMRPLALATNLDKTRATLMDLLLERVYDVSSFTRAATLKAWTRLISASDLGSSAAGVAENDGDSNDHDRRQRRPVVPKERLVPITRVALDRLQDKTVLVRKQAMQLLTALLENNPFLGSLDPDPYRSKLGDLYEYVRANLPKSIQEAHSTTDLNQRDEVDPDLEQVVLAAAIVEGNTMLDRFDELDGAEKVFCRKIQALQFTQRALDFIDLFDVATVHLEAMLLSANTSDVTEALRFFIQARHFQLPCAVTGMKRALALMWSSEASIRDEVIKAFIDVFLAQPGSDGRELLSDNQIARNLLVLTGQATVSELASIEEAMHRLVKEERIPPNVFSVLWAIVSSGSPDSRAVALQLISMGAGADRSIVDSKSRLKVLLEAGLGEYMHQRNDWQLAAAAASALQKVERAKVDPTDAKYIVMEKIAEELCMVAAGHDCTDHSKEDTLTWFSASEQAIKALFTISPEPEICCKKILVGMSNATFRQGSVTTCHALRLARFFHVLGHIALHLLVYTESLGSSVRKGNALKSLKKQEDADQKKQGNKRINAPSTASVESDDALEAELGIDAQVEAENERKLAEIAEQEILGRGLISLYVPLLVRVVGNEGSRFNSEVLMQSSTLALCKFMCVSSSFCEKHLPLLFTALSSAPSEDVIMRANTVIALGDLAFRFPNEVEPYTPQLYACLRDPSIKVRRHTLMVLTHLILNDMVKVKGQVCEIALCLRDEDPRIRDMSRLLFHELSKRSNNPVYNLLPDIISQLSQIAIRKEDFRGIMSFLLGYIKKERQNEMLAEKLCQRFAKATEITQKADMAYCIAQLKMNERTIKCLSDNFKLYKDALFDEDVKKSFLSIAIKAKKFIKADMRQALEEWESKLHESSMTGIENQVAGEKASKALARAQRRAGGAIQSSSSRSTKKKAVAATRRKLDFVAEESGGGHEDSSNDENEPPPSDDDDDELEVDPSGDDMDRHDKQIKRSTKKKQGMSSPKTNRTRSSRHRAVC